jgi:hypothetical protein
MYKVIVLVTLISKDNSDWYKTSATWIGARKVSRPYEEQRGKKGGDCGFPQWIYYNSLFSLCECVCELNEISMKRMRELLVP